MAADIPVASSATTPEAPPLPPLVEFWRYFSANRGALAGLIVIAMLVLLALFADIVSPHLPAEQYRDSFLRPPAWADGGSWRFVLGTDTFTPERWHYVVEHARWSRQWLADLPSDVARKIAYENGDRLFGKAP